MQWWQIRKRDADLDRELQSDLELEEEEQRENGLSPQEAHYAARRAFGNTTLIKEQTHEAWAWAPFERFAQDLGFALRQLRTSPGFAILAVAALSLGIGAATAIFSVMDAVILRPLPFAHQERLEVPTMTSLAGYPTAFSYPAYLDLRAQSQTFAVLAAYAGGIDKINLEGPTGAVSLRVIRGTDNFFDVLGVRPLLGRTYLPGEDQTGRDDIVVLSYEVWKTDFAGERDVVGKTVHLGGTPYTVIGVMPQEFRFPLSAQDVIYTPLHPVAGWTENRGPHWLRAIGLVKTGVSHTGAVADFNRVLSSLGRSFPNTDGGVTGSLIPLLQQVNTLDSGQNALGPLGTLAFACLALLGIACVNVAGMLLGRGVRREREMAMRTAIGASRTRLVRQLVTESVVLGVSGLAGGVLVSCLLLKIMNVFLVKSLARGADVHLNITVVAVALAISMVTSMLSSIVPALRLSRTDPNRALRATGAGAGSGRNQHRMRSTFVIIQIALSFVLLVVSGLLLRNLRGLLSTDLGFDPSKILAMEIDLSPGRYNGRDPVTTFYRPLLEKISHIPGVEGAGIIDNLPMLSWGSSQEVHISGQPPSSPNQHKSSEIRFVSSGYFDAMGIRLVRGRLLSPQLDRVEINPNGAIVVNEAFSREFLSNGADPVGAQLDGDPAATTKTSIVGVVTNVRQDLHQPPMAEMDWPMDELAPKVRLDFLGSMMLVVRSKGDLSALVAPIRSMLHEVDPTVPFQSPETMTQIVSEQLVLERMESWLFGIFASFAILLAVTGIYGLLSQEVESNTRNIGIRMALGSTRAIVVGEVLRRVAFLMVIGLGLGWLFTLGFRRVMAAVVVIHPGHDFALALVLTATFAAIGTLSAFIPARRAGSVDPMHALRRE
jgi:putative ABC transport system permease protein